eukprot:5376758-Pyramimonas_sp.AAC.1
MVSWHGSILPRRNSQVNSWEWCFGMLQDVGTLVAQRGNSLNENDPMPGPMMKELGGRVYYNS